MLDDVCTPDCQSSFTKLLSAVEKGCGQESYPFVERNMTWVEHVEFFQYKFGLVCMRDQATSNFCIDVESRYTSPDIKKKRLSTDQTPAGISRIWFRKGRRHGKIIATEAPIAYI